jgi:PhnB protein
MAAKAHGIPKGFHTVTPSLTCADAPKAIEFYKKALGAEEVMRFPGPDGRIMYAELKIGDSTLMLGDEMVEQGMKGPRTLGGTPVSFFVYSEDVDAAWQRAIAAGGRQIMPLENQFWGDRAGSFEDPAGHQWWLAQRIKDMTPDELRKSADEFFAQAGAGR